MVCPWYVMWLAALLLARAKAQVGRRDHISCIDFQSDHQSSVMDTVLEGSSKIWLKKQGCFFCSSPFTPGLIVIFIVSRGFVGCDKLCHKQSWKDATLKKQVLLLMVQKLSHHPWGCFKPSAECDSPQVSNHYNCTFHAAIHVMISEYLYTDNKPLSSSFCCPSKAYRRTKRSVTSWKASGRYGWAGVYSSSACCYSSSCSHYH